MNHTYQSYCIIINFLFLKAKVLNYFKYKSEIKYLNYFYTRLNIEIIKYLDILYKNFYLISKNFIQLI